ncbi:MAG: CvpA family protein [Pseudomonadota bacterium]
MNLIWVDYFILVIIFISMIISLLRGFVREALSLAGWIVSIFIAFAYMNQLALLIQPKLSSLPASVLNLLAFSILLVIALIVAGLLNNLIAKLVDKTGLSGTDRAIGMLFGIARGMVLIGVLVLLAGFTMVPQDLWWKQSLFLVHFQQLAVTLSGFLPSDLAMKIHY